MLSAFISQPCSLIGNVVNDPLQFRVRTRAGNCTSSDNGISPVSKLSHVHFCIGILGYYIS